MITYPHNNVKAKCHDPTNVLYAIRLFIVSNIKRDISAPIQAKNLMLALIPDAPNGSVGLTNLLVTHAFTPIPTVVAITRKGQCNL
jgi:hypothetical protein